MENSAAVAPLAMKLAFDEQRSRIPNDDDALNRLFDYLRSTRPTMREIKDAVCDFYCLKEVVLTSPTRNIDTCLARQIFCYLAYKHTRASLSLVGVQAGGLDHTTVRHAFQKITKKIRTTPRTADEIDLLSMRIAEKVLLRSNRRLL